MNTITHGCDYYEAPCKISTVLTKVIALHSICTTQHMLIVIHNIHPQHMFQHILWVYVVENIICCGCMLWGT